jgi:hypothetical protein
LPWNAFIVSWVRETDLKLMAIYKYHSRYIRPKFIFFFALKSMEIISWPDIFIRVKYLIIFYFQKKSELFELYLKLLKKMCI